MINFKGNCFLEVKQSTGYQNRLGKNRKICSVLSTSAAFIKSSRGITLIETAFTLPIVCYLLLFVLELMKINVTQSAIDAMCSEMTYDLVATGSWNNFEEIMDKHRPAFIPKKGADGYDVVRFAVNTWGSLDAMVANVPYGGTSIHYPDYVDLSSGFKGGSQAYSGGHSACIPVDGIDYQVSGADAYNWQETRDWLLGKVALSRRMFVLDVVVAYPFSSAFIKKLFHGGSNSMECTHANGANLAPTINAEKYLLWARGVGITN